jgi:1-acyl-sn-glycerol-3-phosphate acyltransferase
MRGKASNSHEIAKWDPAFTEQVKNAVQPLVKLWFRAEVRNVENIPPAGGALVVSNHSGGMFTPDVLIFAPAFYDTFGYHRPLYTLAHYGLFIGPLDGLLRRLGVIEASRENAFAALYSDAVVLVFPGGDYDVYRPTLGANTVDFNGRTGYVRTAIEAGVPIVPMVSIGGQETQLFLTRGNWLARRLGLTKARINILPVSFGFPFGLTAILPPNLPLPRRRGSRRSRTIGDADRARATVRSTPAPLPGLTVPCAASDELRSAAGGLAQAARTAFQR